MNALRVALWPYSAERLFIISRLSRSAERSKRIFTGGVVTESGSCCAASCGSAALRLVSSPSQSNPADLTERARTLAGNLANAVSLRGVFLSLPTKNSPGGLPEEHSFFYSKHGYAALTWCAAGLTSGTLPRRGRRCRPECRTPEIRLRPAHQPAALRT